MIIPQILICGLIWREIAQVCPRVAQVASLSLFPHICRVRVGMSGVSPVSHLCAVPQGRIEHDVLILVRLENSCTWIGVPHKSDRTRLSAILRLHLLWGAICTGLGGQGRSREKVAVLSARMPLLRGCKALFEPVHALTIIVDGDAIRSGAAMAPTPRIDCLIVVARLGSAGVSLFFADSSAGLGKVFLGCQDLPQVINRHLGIRISFLCIGSPSQVPPHQLSQVH